MCTVLPCGPAPVSWLMGLHREPQQPPASVERPVVADLDAVAAAAQATGDDVWHPIMLDWRVTIHDRRSPSDSTGSDESTDRYRPDHVTSHCTLASNEPDLSSLNSDVGEHRESVVTGRSLLTTHVETEMLEALKRRTPPPEKKRSAQFESIVARAEELLESPTEPLQSASLSGFNSALLMHETIFGLDVDDPLAFPETRDFARRVANAVGHHTSRAPEPLLDFMPIRSGDIEVTQLRLIDSFGRVNDFPDDDESPLVRPSRLTVFGAEALVQVPVDDETPPAVGHRLPPRLLAPARLHMRWLAAGGSADEGPDPVSDRQAHDHPDTGPICGWLVPNVLDAAIMVHGAAGDAIGSIDQSGRWRPPPGQDRFTPPDDIADPALRQIVVHLLHETDDARSAFLQLLVEALARIAPDNHGQHQSIALLMGRPIAVVRASVRLELLGTPPASQSWMAFRTSLDGKPPDHAGLEDVQFPLRIGEQGQLDDGVVGFWVEGEFGFAESRFYDTQARTTDQSAGAPDEPNDGDRRRSSRRNVVDRGSRPARRRRGTPAVDP